MSYERENIRHMEGYRYGEQPDDPGVVKLNTNENPYPPSPAVAAALAAFDADELRRYPPAQSDAFRRLAAEQLGLTAEEILVTNGGDEALRLAFTTFVDPGSVFAMAYPSYSLYEVLARVQGCRIESIPLADDWSLPADFCARANRVGARLTCLVNPHAPSGVLLDVVALARIADEIEGVVLIDEAYVDFVDPALGHDATQLIREFDNLLLLRTLSKGYSLAGLRFGFLLGNPRLLEPIATKTRDSFNQDMLAQTLACAAYADGAYACDTGRRVRRAREALRSGLAQLGFSAPASQTNFLLVVPPANWPFDARSTYEQLKVRGILLRHFDTPRLGGMLRITAGTPEQNSLLLDALRDIGKVDHAAQE